MKIALLINLLISSLLVHAQKTEVMIFGTFHHFNDEYKSLQNFEKIRNDLATFQPDIICIESIPIDDTLSLNEILPDRIKRADTLKAQLAAGQFQSTATPNQLKAAELWSNYDFWNAYYYLDTLANDQSPGPFASYHRNLANSEYGNIVFPLGRTLGISSFYNIDYRYNESLFLNNQSKAFKQLIFRLKWKPLRTYLRLQKEFKKSEKDGELIPFINSQEFQKEFGELIDGLPLRLKKSEEAQFVKTYWHKRNRIMAQRIDKAAQEAGAKKVLVTVGSAHVSHIKHYLEPLGYHVTTYGEFLSTKTDND